MSSAPYRFTTELSGFQSSGVQCPPTGAAPRDLLAWRWVANPLTSQCFDPPAVRNPTRLIKDPNKACGSWALSLHVSHQESLAAFKALEKGMKNIRKLFGDHVANVCITQSDGVCTVPDKFGHFDLHQYKASAVHENIADMSPIPCPIP
jgi:hypothetical protein